MARQEKVDLFKVHKDEYAAPRKPVLVKVAKASYLAIEGRGAPGGDEFARKIGALYGAAFTIKMTRKAAGKRDYMIGKLEAQWWGEDDECDLEKTPMDAWRWRLLVRTPEFVSKGDLTNAVSVLLEKGKEREVKEVRLVAMTEGKCIQMLHVGPYDQEGDTIAQMKEFASREGLTPSGKHHEIYLSDPRRVPPERLKTILRMPVRRSK
jgi:hypothetical protein